MLKFALPHTQTLNGSRWNIGHVGSPTRGAGVGHVHLILFVLFLVALGTQRKCDIQWNTGFGNFPSVKVFSTSPHASVGLNDCTSRVI